MRAINPCLSDALLFLTLFPVGLWLFSFYLCRKIREAVVHHELEPEKTELQAIRRTIDVMPGTAALFLLFVIEPIVNCLGH
jgi:hypothetical protein